MSLRKDGKSEIKKRYITTIKKKNYTINIFVNEELEAEKLYMDKLREIAREFMKIK
ncbi:hypothetical protein [Bacillus sp. JJ1474]|uniref:hypothetical protein n=1 Tax=Bacillus sp. JJ1474 TaxID=3122955 RepID=UPI002FFEFA92